MAIRKITKEEFAGVESVRKGERSGGFDQFMREQPYVFEELFRRRFAITDSDPLNAFMIGAIMMYQIMRSHLEVKQ